MSRSHQAITLIIMVPVIKFKLKYLTEKYKLFTDDVDDTIDAGKL